MSTAPCQCFVIDGDGQIEELAFIGEVSMEFVLDGDASVVLAPGGGDVYTGDYEVTPRAWSDVVLPTRNKLMADDVTVFEIPTYETSNPYGKTFIIGED